MLGTWGVGFLVEGPRALRVLVLGLSLKVCKLFDLNPIAQNSTARV